MGKKLYTSHTPSGKMALFVDGLGRYSLKDTLECGQCFRFDRVEGEYADEYCGMAGEHFVHVAQQKAGELIFIGADERAYHDYLENYFALDVDWAELNAKIKASDDREIMQTAAEMGAGIAILRQDIWECLFSFIISQNNNIPRIKKNIKTVCALYGKRVDCDDSYACDDGSSHTFPSPDRVLSSPALLSSARLGFRERYLLDAASRVSRGEIELSSLCHPAGFSEAQKQLCSICGVGEKVSSCVLLFGGGHLGAFPIDVWMKRAIDEYFDGELDASRFGEYAGLAQQYIFHYARNIDSKKDKK